MRPPPSHPRSKWLVTTDWLAGNLGTPGLVVLDGSYYLPAMKRDAAAEYFAGHIPGALRFDIDEVADHSSDMPHMLPSAAAFAAAAGQLGIGDHDTIVAYDGHGMFASPRVWFTFRLFGAKNVFILEGGLPKWRAEGRPLESGIVRRPASTFTVHKNADAVANLDRVRHALAAGSAQVVDARSAARFRGEVPEPRADLRSGHMPGAGNVPWNSLVGEDGMMKPREELQAVFEAAGVDLKKPIVTTCGSGVTAALLALGLARLGREDVAVYDGSWAEWGGRSDTAVVTGS